MHPLVEENRRLRQKIEDLEVELGDLQALLGAQETLPVLPKGLQVPGKTQSKILAVLLHKGFINHTRLRGYTTAENDDNLIRTQICRLRKSLKTWLPQISQPIQCVWGEGYKIDERLRERILDGGKFNG